MPLYLVATPIGNLEDITLRAIRILGEVDQVLAEDTRRTRALLSHHGIRARLLSLHAHNEGRITPALVERLAAGESLALVTDAGTPAISDPGERLVAAAAAAGVAIVPIPGPSAVLAALTASGLAPAPFTFLGFLARKQSAQREALSRLASLPHTLVFFESPNRTALLLRNCLELLGDRRAVVARELTKLYEELRRGSLSELAVQFAEEPPRGEVVVVVEGKTEGESDDSDLRIDRDLRLHLDDGLSPSQAARICADATGLPKNRLYARALELERCASSDAGESDPHDERSEAGR